MFRDGSKGFMSKKFKYYVYSVQTKKSGKRDLKKLGSAEVRRAAAILEACEL
jgi:hypothetical protein